MITAYGVDSWKGRRLLITGGCGFIGSALVRHLVGACGAVVLNVDKLTYAGTQSAVAEVSGLSSYEFLQQDICDYKALTGCVSRFRPDAIMHLAAESHVDRSISGPAEFVQTNVTGTLALLEAARDYWEGLLPPMRDAFRFVHVSTDEVYGSLSVRDDPFTEQSRYCPNSPYSASKAGADHLVRAWHRTYGLPTIISNCSNNFGPYQNPEKMIPTMILAAMQGAPLPVYGKGDNIRDWLFVDDHVAALLRLLQAGDPGETYLIGGGGERCNIDVVREICRILDTILPPLRDGIGRESLIRFVQDRKGHDLRYAVDSAKAKRELGWQPRETFSSGLLKTVQWYLDNQDWCRDRIADIRTSGNNAGHA